jgi:hypothetical protein
MSRRAAPEALVAESVKMPTKRSLEALVVAPGMVHNFMFESIRLLAVVIIPCDSPAVGTDKRHVFAAWMCHVVDVPCCG